MATISPTTRETIKGYLEGFIEGLVTHYKERKIKRFETPQQYLSQKSSPGQLKPFHAAMIPTELLRINEFERGFSTRLGNTFEECARLIALENHQNARRGYDIKGEVSRVAKSEIERQIAIFERALESKTNKPTLEEMVDAVLLSRRSDDLEAIALRCDLYILGRDGTEFFFEMKSPKPNKGQCLEVTQRLLRFHLLRGQSRPELQAYFSMAYNPFGPTRSDYRWSYALNYMPFEQAVVIGDEFWNIVGGSTTYEELLEIYQEVGRERSKYMIDALAFGF